MMLLIDNYDSFTYNIYQYVASKGADIKVFRNDQLSVSDIAQMNPEAIILSPGPGRPEQAGGCPEIVETYHARFPILGICLGHQIIAHSFGSSIIQASTIKHGKTSWITHDGNGLFSHLPQTLEVMRYHSLVIDRHRLSDSLEATATSLDDQEIMGIKHRQYPVYGIQFHPESIGTATGKKMIENFLHDIRKESIV